MAANKMSYAVACTCVLSLARSAATFIIIMRAVHVTAKSSNHMAAEVDTISTTTLEFSVQDFTSVVSMTPKVAQGLVEWLKIFWLSTQQRDKHNASLSLTLDGEQLLVVTCDSTNSTSTDHSYWEKQM